MEKVGGKPPPAAPLSTSADGRPGVGGEREGGERSASPSPSVPGWPALATVGPAPPALHRAGGFHRRGHGREGRRLPRPCGHPAAPVNSPPLSTSPPPRPPRRIAAGSTGHLDLPAAASRLAHAPPFSPWGGIRTPSPPSTIQRPAIRRHRPALPHPRALSRSVPAPISTAAPIGQPSTSTAPNRHPAGRGTG